MAAGSAAVSAALGPALPRLRGLRVAYTASVALLIALALATLASPMLLPALRRGQPALPDASKLQVLAKADKWVLQYNLTNGTPQDSTYTFEIVSAETGDAARGAGTVGQPIHTTSVLVGAGRTYVFIYHLRPGEVPPGPVRFLLLRGGDAAPIEDVTLHVPAVGSAR